MEQDYRPKQAKTAEVIIVEATRGKGTDDDPIRGVYQFWSKQGRFITEKDVTDFPMERF
ncbi:hypothetical protein M3M38_07225 [Fructilactobacillus cliffordii]|uniref:hypothetical protein n=1 Tax=Fructilactobacillus cliffordii TaxID=2940299 RepID=UPI002092784B|nr:hypothetical protein [Fructilactobacillus cliffordii]USS86450.1 hypothetical protein M3M38_07225 [Fructilactobacillus cliffordii]